VEAIATCHLTHLENILTASSKDRYGNDKAFEIRNVFHENFSILPIDFY